MAKSRKTITEHLRVCDEKRRALFGKFSAAVKALDPGVQERSWSYGVAYRFNKNFVELYFRSKRLEVCLRPRTYVDPKRLLGRVPESYGWTLNRRFMLEDDGQLEYLMTLVRQSLEDVRRA